MTGSHSRTPGQKSSQTSLHDTPVSGANSWDLTQNGNAQIVSGSGIPNLTQRTAVTGEEACHLTQSRKRGPLSSTLHLRKHLADFVAVVKGMTDDEIAEATAHRATILQTPGGESHCVDPAFLLQHKYDISRRTAYRYLERGFLPPTERRLGGDGKRYPAHPRGSTVTRSHKLALTIRRLARQIDRAELEANDYTILSEAVDAIRELWEEGR